MKIEELYKLFLSCTNACTDTRKLKKDNMYFALKGDNFDGNDFATKASKLGAKYCVVDDKTLDDDSSFILVDDVLTALQQLARYHRDQLTIPIIGLTGSNGKTTTKELINAVLSTKFKTKATIGNLNNHIGVPLSVLSITENDDIGIIEMGANHQKEIEFLSAICQPDYGLITNFGKAHLEGFGGVEGVIKGKSELYDYLKANDKTAIINTDDQKQIEQIGNYKKVYTFGSSQDNDCTITFKKAIPYVTVDYLNTAISSNLVGDYNFSNIAVAIALGHNFEVSKDLIKNAIESYTPNNNRSEILNKDSNLILLDAYNANPTSMLAALKNFLHLEYDHKVLFLGDMFELGEDAAEEHQSIVNYVEKHFKDRIFLVGENFYKTQCSDSTLKFQYFESLKSKLTKGAFKNSAILIKGSRGMALERILEYI
ncbi:MAG: UDP-N-acetylmuramoyl-tripeptide--D-alanyl-D-alanine ligase [Winogradskyella sp.]|nr:UDP-N-acetylmuramoyl-tripeptide--D-alanyl-D-alanine ligase [Winogradskyella sp.]